MLKRQHDAGFVRTFVLRRTVGCESIRGAAARRQ